MATLKQKRTHNIQLAGELAGILFEFATPTLRRKWFIDLAKQLAYEYTFHLQENFIEWLQARISEVKA